MKDVKDIGYISKGMIMVDLKNNRRTVVNIIFMEGITPIVEFDDGEYLYTTIGWENFPRGICVENSEQFLLNEIPIDSILLSNSNAM